MCARRCARALFPLPVVDFAFPTAPHHQGLWKSYGYLFIGTYFSIYFIVLGSTYVLVRRGVLPGPDIGEWINSTRLKRWVCPDKDLHLSKRGSDFLTAWLITKTTEPARAAITIVAIPVMVRYLPATALRFLRVIPKTPISKP